MGSGRDCYWGAKDTTDDYRSIDVRRWRRDGLLTPHQSFEWQWSLQGDVVASIRVRTETGRVILTYRHRSGGGDWKDESYPVYLDWTACHFGGRRPWFLCPGLGCGRRVAILHGGEVFACRTCHDLVYASQRESWGERAVRSADRVRGKLDWEPGVFNGKGTKPKGMHWRTYERLALQHDELVEASLAELELKLKILGESIDWKC